MNEPFDTIGDEPIEARIVAWVLGEASAFESAELERLCEERPELLVFQRRMRALHSILVPAESPEIDDSWKLPDTKRKALEEILGDGKVVRLEPNKEIRIRRSGRRALLAIAACVILTIVIAKLIGPIGHISPISLTKSDGSRDEVPSPSKTDSSPAVQALSKIIRDQEDKVEERRKVLATIVRTKGIIYKGQDSFYGASGMNEDSREEAIKRGLDAQDYADAKRDFETDQDLLQQMKLKQIDRQLARNDHSSGAAGEKNVASQPTPLTELAMKSPKPRVVPRQAQGGASMNQGPAARITDSENSPSAAPVEEMPMAPAVDLAKAKAKKSLASDEINESGGVMSLAAASSNSDAMINNPDLKDEMKSDHGALARNGSFNKSDRGGSAFGGGKGIRMPSLSQPKSEASRRGGIVNSPVPASESLLEKDESPGLAAADKLNLETDARSSRSNAQQIENKEERSFADLAQKSSDPGEISFSSRAEDDRFSKVDKDLKTSAPAVLEGADLAEASDPSLKRDQAQAPIQTPLESIEEITAIEEPYSTFSLNINDASFQIAKAALDKGNRPDPAGVKVEQFYNAVDYGDPAPASNEPVAATIEQSAHPIIPGRNLVRVALKTAAAGRGASQPLRLTLLVDQSGSMVREDRRAAMANALKQLGSLLTSNDHITVVGFSREAHLLADDITGDQSAKLSDLVNQTANEGGTNLEQALNLGEEMAARHRIEGDQNRIVLFTDGAANLGDAKPERLAERVKSLRQKGIAFDIAGIGADGLNDRLLSELARNGNGRYYVVSDDKIDSLARQLAGAFRPAAENVKVQVHFNPDRVRRYKLIGFEKDRLKTEDFRNDAVDAAELAAEEAGVAIYQVETLPQGAGEIGEVSVRFRDTAKSEMVERTWTMPFESSALPFDRASPAMQLAGLSMLAADKLRGGPLADAIDFKQLSASQSLVKQFYGSSTRVADMLHVIDLLK